MRVRTMLGTGLSAVALAALFPGGGMAAPGSAERCWPAQPTCPAKQYERKAAQASSRHAREEFGKDFPPDQWTIVCYEGPSPRKLDCSTHSRDELPYDCVGGMTMKKIDGRWKARKIEMSCAA